RVASIQTALGDPERFSIELLRLDVGPLILVNSRQGVEDKGHVRVVRACCPFEKAERLRTQRPGSAVLALITQRSRTLVKLARLAHRLLTAHSHDSPPGGKPSRKKPAADQPSGRESEYDPRILRVDLRLAVGRLDITGWCRGPASRRDWPPS